jgi:ABC-type nitrate/sulfonate/bicarbonate transport system permease component
MNRAQRYAILALTVAVFVLVWWALAAIKNNPQQFAGPIQTVQAFIQIFTNPVLRSTVLASLEVTLTSVFFGFSLAVIVGIPVGFLMGRYVAADLLLDPWVNSWYSIPAVAFVPLLMNWTGLTSTSSILIAFLIAVFSIIITVYSGVKNTSRSLIDTARAYNASEGQLISKIIFPASLPNIMIGLRLGITRAIEGVIIAEMFFAAIGLGGMIDYSADHLQSAVSDALIIVLVMVSVALSQALKYINEKTIAWKESESMIRL